MKKTFHLSMILLVVVLATAAWASAPTPSATEAPLPEAATSDVTPALDAELFPAWGQGNRSAQQCNQLCYDQAILCRALCGNPGDPGYTQCINQCSIEEYQCNCDCGAIPGGCDRF